MNSYFALHDWVYMIIKVMSYRNSKILSENVLKLAYPMLFWAQSCYSDVSYMWLVVQHSGLWNIWSAKMWCRLNYYKQYFLNS